MVLIVRIISKKMNLSLDDFFDKEKIIKFYPYIGDDYFISSPRVLFLGESHYLPAELEVNNDQIRNYNSYKYTTRDVVENDYNKAYLSSICMLSNSLIDNDWVYNKVCFYNFFQEYIGFGSSGKSLITEDMINLSRKAYNNIIETLQPDLIITWGVGPLFNYWVPQEGCEILGGDDFLYKYIKYPKTKIWHIKHPSCRSFNLFETTYKLSEICKHLNIDYPFFQKQ